MRGGDGQWQAESSGQGAGKVGIRGALIAKTADARMFFLLRLPLSVLQVRDAVDEHVLLADAKHQREE
jgi:hypothetical protein